MPNQRNQERKTRRASRQDWYESDPMDERSGYRDDEEDLYRPVRQAQRPRRGASQGDYFESDYESNRFGRQQDRENRDSYTRSHRYGTDDFDYDRDRYVEEGFYGRGQQTGERNFGQFNQSGFDRDRDQTRGQYSGRGPKGFQRTDERIKEEVCEILTRHSDIDAHEIEVEVSEGVVTLEGNVPERRMKHMAEDAIEHSYGVKEVNNNIRVRKEDEERTSESSRSGSERSSGRGKSSTH